MSQQLSGVYGWNISIAWTFCRHRIDDETWVKSLKSSSDKKIKIKYCMSENSSKTEISNLTYE